MSLRLRCISIYADTLMHMQKKKKKKKKKKYAHACARARLRNHELRVQTHKFIKPNLFEFNFCHKKYVYVDVWIYSCF